MMPRILSRYCESGKIITEQSTLLRNIIATRMTAIKIAVDLLRRKGPKDLTVLYAHRL
jgi:hypothetical protein